jgi:hypothetical protein
MLINAFIFVLSGAAMIQFAVFSWRAHLLKATAHPAHSPALDQLANLMQSKDFDNVAALQELCPRLGREPAEGLRAVNAYYQILQLAARLGEAIFPAAAMGWTQREMALCTSYSTMVLSKRLERNRAFLAEIDSY